MSLISIEEMHFHAYHGCFKEEQLIGTKFNVDLYIETDTTVAEQTDDLESTIDYQSVFLVVKEEMDVPSKLLEHAGRRILDRIMKEFPGAFACEIKLSKLNPPLGGHIGAVSLTMGSERD